MTGLLIAGALIAAASLVLSPASLNAQQVPPATAGGFLENPMIAVFRRCDVDGDGQLTEGEYLKRGGGRDVKTSIRDFKVFDSNRDGSLDLTEFLAVVIGQPESQKGVVFDPIIRLSERGYEAIERRWAASDMDGNGVLNPKEFASAGIAKLVRGLETTRFEDWDLNADQSVSLDEVKMVLDIAFGVRTPEGDLLRSRTGYVVHWSMYRPLKKNADGFVSIDDYYSALGPLENRQQWFDSIDKNGDLQFDFVEFSGSNHRTCPVQQFLGFDTNLDGKLSPDELEAVPADWYPGGEFLFPGFDDDQDGFLSLEEFQLSPVINLLAVWQSASDTNGDGLLSPDEFRFMPGVSLAALSAEYFRRLDVDKSGQLSQDEFPFGANASSAYKTEFIVRSPDGSIKKLSVPGYPIICSPEISPDGNWVAVDGWKYGENNVAAHLLVRNVNSDEVRDLGIGCIPHWSADGRQLAYSKYGQGVFIRNFEGAVNEDSIDRSGWAIHFSTDGKKLAYAKDGGNLVICDRATRKKHFVFPPGKSPYNYIEHNFCWSPDSMRICFKGYKSNGEVDVASVAIGVH